MKGKREACERMEDEEVWRRGRECVKGTGRKNTKREREKKGGEGREREGDGGCYEEGK